MEEKMPYNKNTVINGKNINLTAQESSGAANFHKSRIAFAFLSNGQCAVNVKDQREHRVYLQEEYNLPSQEFEKLDRGYIKDGKIVFYKTSFFRKVDNISPAMLNTVLQIAKQYFGTGNYEIWNGLQVGKVGEEWNTPLEIVTVVAVN